MSTAWEIYTLQWLTSDNQTVQTAIELATVGVLAHRALQHTSRLRRLSSPRMGYAFRWNEQDPEYNRVRIEREEVRDFLLRQERRQHAPDGRQATIDIINNTHRDFRLLSDVSYYSAMEEMYPNIGSN